MTKNGCWIRQARQVLFGAALVLIQGGLQTTLAAGSHPSANDAEQRLVLEIGLVTYDSDVTSIRHSVRIERAIMVHRLRLQLVDATGSPAVAGAAWELVAEVQSPDGGSVYGMLARLGSAAPEFRLPRPLGFRLEAGDMLQLTVTFGPLAGSHGGGSHELRLVVEYEPDDIGVSRLVALPRPLQPLHRDSASISWEWQPGLDGWLAALTGSALDGAVELTLRDAATGDLVWRERRGVAGVGFGAERECTRVGAAVAENRSYLLTALYGAAHDQRGDELVVLVVPARAGR